MESKSSTISIMSDNKIEIPIEFNRNKWKLTLIKNYDGIKLSLGNKKTKFIYENNYDNYDLNKFPIFKNIHKLLDYANIFNSSINKKKFKIEENIESVNFIIIEHNINLKLYITNIIKLLLNKIEELEIEINQLKETIILHKSNDLDKNDNKEKNIITIGQEKSSNYIKATYHIKKNDLNKEIKIIDPLGKHKNELENNCAIYLNNQQINSPYIFQKESKYIITFNFKKQLEDISRLFSLISQLIEIDLSNFNSQKVKSMQSLFSTSRNLKKINFKNFNTNKVTDMKDMFSNCDSLEELDLSSFQTQNVQTMENMFFKCISLKKINVKSFDIRNVTTMKYMFGYCENLTDLDLSNFENEKDTNIDFMFSNCKNLIYLDFSKFVIPKNMSSGTFNEIPKEHNFKLNIVDT